MKLIGGGNHQPEGVRIVDWISRKTGKRIQTLYFALGWCDKNTNELISGAYFVDYTGTNVEMHVHGKLFRQCIMDTYKYVFDYCKCMRLTVKPYRSNTKLLKILPRAGFVYEGFMKDFYDPGPAGDAMIYRLDRDVAKEWMNKYGHVGNEDKPAVIVGGTSDSPTGANLGQWYMTQSGNKIYPPYSCLGWIKRNQLIGVFVLYDFTGYNVSLHVHMPGHLGRDKLKALFSYIFLNLNCTRATVRLEAGNAVIRRLLEGLGFVKEAVLVDCCGPGKDALIYRMLKSEAKRWIE